MCRRCLIHLTPFSPPLFLPRSAPVSQPGIPEPQRASRCNGHCGPCLVQYVDEAIAKAILGRGANNLHDNGSSSDEWNRRAIESCRSGRPPWCKQHAVWVVSERLQTRYRASPHMTQHLGTTSGGGSTPQPCNLGWRSGTHPT